MMCGLCSPETAKRIVDANIFFDRKEAAEFVKECGPWLIDSYQLSLFFQLVADAMILDDNGNKNGREKLDFETFWKSNEQYKTEAMKKNFAGCKKVNNDYS